MTVAWGPNLQHPQYGTPDTYQLAANWLAGCPTVADWGGGTGHFRHYLPPTVRYTVVDSTQQYTRQVLADLRAYAAPSDGILLRHVLDHNEAWRTILENAMLACRHRIAVVTFTPPAHATRVVKMKSGWPILHFNVDEVRSVMGRWLFADIAVQTSHPEHVYLMERPCAS